MRLLTNRKPSKWASLKTKNSIHFRIILPAQAHGTSSRPKKALTTSTNSAVLKSCSVQTSLLSTGKHIACLTGLVTWVGSSTLCASSVAIFLLRSQLSPSRPPFCLTSSFSNQSRRTPVRHTTTVCLQAHLCKGKSHSRRKTKSNQACLKASKQSFSLSPQSKRCLSTLPTFCVTGNIRRIWQSRTPDWQKSWTFASSYTDKECLQRRSLASWVGLRALLSTRWANW